MIRITLTPNPPHAGASLKICYDFNGSGITDADLKIFYVPPDSSADIKSVSVTTPCVVITCPKKDSITVQDLDGGSEEVTSPIL